MKKERTDAQINKAKVAKSIIQEPLKTERQIAQETWLGKTTVHEHLKEIVKQQRYIELIEEKERKTRIISNDFKKEISDERLSKYIEKCGSKIKAMELLNNYIDLYIWDMQLTRTIKTNTRYEVLSRSNFKCQACWNKPNKDNDVVLHIDHILPFSKWWSNEINNLQVLCSDCNLSKKDFFNIDHNINENR